MKNLIVSVHDFSPKYMGELKEIFGELTFQAIKRSILVVPNLQNKYSVQKFGDTVYLLCKEKDIGSEILLHGYNHTDAAIYREFKNLSFESAIEKIKAGKTVMSELEIEVNGFVPPYYKISQAAEQAVKASGFDILVKNPDIVDLKKSIAYSSRALWYWPYNRLVDFGFRLYNEFQLDFELSKTDLVRVDIHPQDMWKGMPFKHALGIIERVRNERAFSSYSDYIKCHR